MDKTEELEELEFRLASMKREHLNAWEIYGSELCAGEMLRKEKELQEKIDKLKENS